MEKDNHQKYVDFVNDNYEPNLLDRDRIDRFRSPPVEPGCSLTIEERAFLYVAHGFPLMLPGGTGKGKTTLCENIASRLSIPYYLQEGNNKLSIRRAMVEGSMQNGSTIMYPGQLTLAAHFEGMYHLEEIANVADDKIVDFHAAMQKKGINVPTHFGNVHYSTDNVRFVGAGNFAYQQPDFNNATLQRWVWVQLPYMDGDAFESALKEDRAGKGSVAQHPDEISSMEDKFKVIFEQQRITAKSLSSLAKLMRKVRERIGQEAPEIDQNPNCYKKAMRCYSPELTTGDFYHIMLETIVYPLSAKDWYTGRHEKVNKLKDIVQREIKSHKSLFKKKQEQARKGGFAQRFMAKVVEG